MRLTDEEKRLYHGDRGPIVAQAMDYLVKLGEACDADSMVDISYAHISGGAPHLLNSIEEILEMAAAGVKVVVPASSEIIITDVEQWQAMGTPEDLALKQISLVPAHSKMGIATTYTCTPYLMGYLPPKGAHVSSVETSAIVYFNSILGARTNRDGLFALYAALVGKYPACGFHLDRNRKATHRVHVEAKVSGSTDYGALGYCIGERVGGGVPIITGLPVPSLEEIIALGAAMNTSGQVALYHIPGLTAECRTPEDVMSQGTSCEESSVSDSDVRRVYEKLHTAQSDTVDFVNLGCPHYTLEDIGRAAELIEGRRVHDGVRFWISTHRGAKAIADLMGYTKVIEDAGGLLICDCCGVVSHFKRAIRQQYNLPVPAVNTMMTDSIKQAKYANEIIGCTTIAARLENCIEAAVTGKGVV
ncbi:aconitase X [Chloroflexota bacterium]